MPNEEWSLYKVSSHSLYCYFGAPAGPLAPACVWCLSPPSLFRAPALPQVLPSSGKLLWAAPQTRLHGPPAASAPLASLVYGFSNELEVQTAPGGSSWTGAPIWGTSPQVPGAHYTPSLGPFTSCLFAGWVPDTQAGPSGCAGFQVGSRPGQPVMVQSSRMKGDLVFYDSLVWLMGSLEGLPARGPEPHGSRLVLWQVWGAQRQCTDPTPDWVL